MAISIGSQGSVTFFKMAYVDKIEKPYEVRNQFTVKEEWEASGILEKAGVVVERELKEMIKKLDMTAISTKELALLGAKLSEAGLINSDATSLFIEGNRDCDINGQPIRRDVKFNAVALFNQRYEGQLEFNKKQPAWADHIELKSILDDIKLSNHLLAALSYFADSSKGSLSFNIRA